MKALFVGGTGIISTACTDLAVAHGIDLWHLRRGGTGDERPGVQTLTADVRDREAASKALAGHRWDAVVNFVGFTPEHVETDLALFGGKTRHYVYVSSASAYQKPPASPWITDDTPLRNPHWQYSRDKIASEDRLWRAYRDEGFPATVVRPSLTYGDTLIPLALNSWRRSWTVPARMLAGKPVVVPGDGTSLWTTTHNTDFAAGLIPLLGRPDSVGHAFHITSEESITWDRHYLDVADALGVEARLVHVPSDLIAAWSGGERGGLHGDKMHSVIFDLSKLRSFVPDYAPKTPFRQGVARSIAWFQADESRQVIDEEFDAWSDRLLDAYAKAWPEGVTP